MAPGPRIGAVFPQTELGGDPGVVRAWVQAVTELGYQQITIYDHVVGADPTVHTFRDPLPYDIETNFHEVLVLYGFMAALTPLELVTSILILPQRPTVLVAKQAAELDLLTGGHFRLGVGIGWNPVEYEALGQSFSNRGRRVEEQIELLRKLWTEPNVTFHGKYEHVTAAGIRPLPLQRPIPVWIGATADVALARAGRIADGWFPQEQPGAELQRMISVVNAAAGGAGRDPSALGMEGRIHIHEVGIDGVAQRAHEWAQAGATHISVSAADTGLPTPDAHIAALAQAAQALGLQPQHS